MLPNVAVIWLLATQGLTLTEVQTKFERERKIFR